MKDITYRIGDATHPSEEGNKIIAHICNDQGKWGAGFVLALSKRSKEPELEYLKWYKTRKGFMLGAVQFVQISRDTEVANIIGQHKTRTYGGDPPIRYDAVENALEEVRERAKQFNMSVCMPRIGCGLAGGEWQTMEPIINRQLSEHDIKVVVYDLP